MQEEVKSSADATPAKVHVPGLGIALGSGSARGWAHIGVLRALEELDIEPHFVAGCSIGALVGAAWAAQRLDALEEWARDMDWWQILRFVDFRAGALVAGDRLLQAFAERIGNPRIEDLPRRFACVATDLAQGREVWFQEGSLLAAVRASIALPGILHPVAGGSGWLVDGGLVNPVPVSLARAQGATHVIAVNLNGDLVGRYLLRRRARAPRLLEPFAQRLQGLLGRDDTDEDGDAPPASPPSLFEIVVSSMNVMQDRITRSRMAGDPPDVLLAPRLGHLALLDFHRAEEAIAIGRLAVEHNRAALLDLVGRPLEEE